MAIDRAIQPLAQRPRRANQRPQLRVREQPIPVLDPPELDISPHVLRRRIAQGITGERLYQREDLTPRLNANEQHIARVRETSQEATAPATDEDTPTHVTSLLQSADIPTMFRTLLSIPNVTTHHRHQPLHVIADTGATFAEVTSEFVELILADQCVCQGVCKMCSLGYDNDKTFYIWTDADTCVEERGAVEFSLRVGLHEANFYMIRAHITKRFRGPILIVGLQQPELLLKAIPYLLEALPLERAGPALAEFLDSAKEHIQPGDNVVRFLAPPKGETTIVRQSKSPDISQLQETAMHITQTSELRRMMDLLLSHPHGEPAEDAQESMEVYLGRAISGQETPQQLMMEDQMSISGMENIEPPLGIPVPQPRKFPRVARKKRARSKTRSRAMRAGALPEEDEIVQHELLQRYLRGWRILCDKPSRTRQQHQMWV